MTMTLPLNRLITSLCALAFAVGTCAAEPNPFGEPKPGSPAFERMKSLVGTWKGKGDFGNGPEEITVQFRVIANGTVIEERCFPGQPHEMVTMYYDQAGSLAMTHYCVLGNRPSMSMTASDAKSVEFTMDKACGIDASREAHMHGIRISFDDANTITTSCRSFKDGQEQPVHATTLTRVAGS